MDFLGFFLLLLATVTVVLVWQQVRPQKAPLEPYDAQAIQEDLIAAHHALGLPGIDLDGHLVPVPQPIPVPTKAASPEALRFWATQEAEDAYKARLDRVRQERLQKALEMDPDAVAIHVAERYEPVGIITASRIILR